MIKGGSGALRHTLTFEVKTETQDKYGAAVETWATDFTCRGAFEPLGSKEFPESWKRNDETTARFRIRYRAGIDCARHRIVFNFDPHYSPSSQSIWEIFPPIPVGGKRRELHIEARETR